MPMFRQGDMWSVFDDADLFLITTNSTLKGGSNGPRLVMGRGIARQARDRFPGLDIALGRHIHADCGHLGRYGLLVSPRRPAAKLGAFQVKTHFAPPASLDLIQFSTSALCAWCRSHPDARVHLNFPGIGNGRLTPAGVRPIVMQLPEIVTIWSYPSA